MSTLPRLMKRLSAMSAAELRFRAAAGARREAGRLAYSLRRPTWRREELASALCPDEPNIGRAIRRLAARDWSGAHQTLMDHFGSRTPRFVLDPRRGDALSRRIRSAFPTAAAESARRADRILEGRFDVLGYRALSYKGDAPQTDGSIDWHLDPVHHRRAPLVHWSRVPYLSPACGDHKIIWELNRHQHWLALGRAWWLTGDERYRQGFVLQLGSWMTANPPGTGINWASMLELGLRSLSWIWALHFFTRTTGTPPDTSAWTVDLLLGLDRQLAQVERNLSHYFSPNTHLTGEALALYVAGRALPELRRAAGWQRAGRAVLLDESSRQINADGGHVELSAHYHRYTLDYYLLALAVARATGDRAAVPEFAEAATRLAVFARTIADRWGRLPRIGDDDAGALFPICGRDSADVSDSLELAALLLDRPDLAVSPATEEPFWMTDRPRAASTRTADWPSSALSASGYFVSRSSRGDHLVVDAGPHGFLGGGHAHADALSLTLTVADRPFLIDPGTGCYTISRAKRDRFRSTRFHNTLTLNGRSQSIPDGPFGWLTTAAGVAHNWRSNPAFDYFEGLHDGYAPSVHRRAILASPGLWLIFDAVEGSGPQQADVHWHLDPSWTAALLDPGRLRADRSDGRRLWMLSCGAAMDVYRGRDGADDLGWCAPAYGPAVPTATVRLSRRASAPFLVVSVVAESADPPSLERLPVRTDRSDACAIAFRLRTASESHVALFAFHPEGGAACGARSAVHSAGGLQTDARLLVRHERPDGQSISVSLVDGSFVSDLESSIALTLARPIRDLHVTLRSEGGFEAVSSEPVPDLTFTDLVGGSRAVPRLAAR